MVMEKKLTPREIKRIESDKKILEAAINIFGKKGYQYANIREIANEAGITPGLISQRFETKENLLLQTVLVANSNWIRKKISLEMSLEELLTNIIEDAKYMYKKDEKTFRFIYTLCNSIDLPENIHDAQKSFFSKSNTYMIMKNAQKEGQLPAGDVESLYNIFVCNAMRLIRDYARLGLVLPDDKYFFAAIQYKGSVIEE